MPELSEKYLEVLLQVSGKNLVAKSTNPLIRMYDEKLKNLKIKEVRSDGKIFRASVCDIDNRNHELLNKNTLICSRQIKFNIHNPFPHSTNNQEHMIYVCLHRVLMGIKVEDVGTPDNGGITIRTVDSHVAGNSRKGRWPKDRFAGAF